MSWLRVFDEPNRFNLLALPPLPQHSLGVHIALVVGMALLTMAIFFISKAVRSPIHPRLIGFELAPSLGSALHIMDRWSPLEKRRARTATLIDFLFLPTLVALIAYPCFWAAISVRPRVPWLAWIGVLMGWATLATLLSGWAEDLAILWTLVRGPGKRSVFLTRLFASLKYGILAIAAAFLLCRIEYFVYELLEPFVTNYPRSTLALLAAVSAVFGVWMLQLANPLRPSLLMLHLAPSRDAANRVLARWGAKRQIARKANWVDMGFAILYTETLAFLFFRAALRHVDLPILASLSQSAGWYMLLAGTFHVVQNCGAEAALRDGHMGWWIVICRRCGAFRVFLLFLGGIWAGILLLLWEGRTFRHALAAIQAAAGAGQ